MRKWNARRKFRQGALGVIATNRMNKMMEGLSTAAKEIEKDKAVRQHCRIAAPVATPTASTCARPTSALAWSVHRPMLHVFLHAAAPFGKFALHCV
jgi:hypothetical protein